MRLKDNVFYIVLIATLLLAAITPGVAAKLQDVGYLSTICIMLMYFSMGLNTDTGALLHGLSNWRLIVFVQAILFCLAPLYAFLLYSISVPFSGKDAAIGLLFIGCIPTTITSCIMLTEKFGGDSVGALYNSVTSQILGVFITPLLLSFFLSTQYSVITPFSSVLKSLTIKMFIPFCAGQLARPVRSVFGQVPKMISFYGIFFILYMNLGHAIHQGNFIDQLSAMVYPLLGSVVLCFLLLVSIVVISGWLKFSFPERICGIFTGAHKTLGMGIPLATIYFPDNVEAAANVSVLIIVYYVFAMFASVFVAESMQTHHIGGDSK